MGEEDEAPKPPRRWPRWVVACIVGFVMFWTTSLFVDNTLIITADSEVTFYRHLTVDRQPAHYRVEFCGIELARADNPDGRDIEHTITLLNWMDVWGTRLVSLVCGLLIGCVVNIFLRLTFQPRRSEAG